MPRVGRRTDRGVPVYDDTVDMFVLSGAEELVPVPIGPPRRPTCRTGATAVRYRPRTEAGFARIVHITGAGGDYWDVWSADGLRSRYGTARPARRRHDWTDPAAIANPAQRPDVRLAADQHTGHARQPHRLQLPADPDGGPQRYLETVRYADYGDPADPSYVVTVTIDYGAPRTRHDPTPIARPDPFSDRRPGFELRTTLRASRISVTTLASDRGAATGPTTVDLSYVDQTADGPVSQPACRC